jgi:hypothetical protein
MSSFRKYYAGIGSRNAPDSILESMEDIGRLMHYKGWILRSGGARGSDSAFERGCDSENGEKQIFLPWKGFNNSDSPLYDIPEEAYAMALEYHIHPPYLKANRGVWKLMARNCQQILGDDLKVFSELVICWTPDGVETGMQTSAKTGGTGQAIRVASDHGIPVFNLRNENSVIRLFEVIEDVVVY